MITLYDTTLRMNNIVRIKSPMVSKSVTPDAKTNPLSIGYLPDSILRIIYTWVFVNRRFKKRFEILK